MLIEIKRLCKLIKNMDSNIQKIKFEINTQRFDKKPQKFIKIVMFIINKEKSILKSITISVIFFFRLKST